MADHYRYLRVEARPGQTPRLIQRLREDHDDARVAVFGAQIGWPATEVRILLHGGDAPLPDACADDSLVEPSTVSAETLVATVRPVGSLSVEATGVFAHRWFELMPAADVDEFIALSAGAWDAGFETLYDARPIALFRGEPREGIGERLLLITRYGSLADWAESRTPLRSTEGQAAEVGRLLRNRQALTARTWVCSSVVVAR